jgi:hypothetical protein
MLCVKSVDLPHFGGGLTPNFVSSIGVTNTLREMFHLKLLRHEKLITLCLG